MKLPQCGIFHTLRKQLLVHNALCRASREKNTASSQWLGTGWGHRDWQGREGNKSFLGLAWEKGAI